MKHVTLNFSLPSDIEQSLKNYAQHHNITVSRERLFKFKVEFSK